jgi:hypothetical protein
LHSSWDWSMERGHECAKHREEAQELFLFNQVEIRMQMPQTMDLYERKMRSQPLEIASKKQHLRHDLPTKVSKVSKMERAIAL